MSSFSLSSRSQGSHFIASPSGFGTKTWILILGSLFPLSFAKWQVKFSDILSCYPTVSGSPEASRVVDTTHPFSYLRSSSNFLTQMSASNWASVASQTAYSRGQPTSVAICFPSLPWCTMPSSSNKCTKIAGMSGTSCNSLQTSNIWVTPPYLSRGK